MNPLLSILLFISFYVIDLPAQTGIYKTSADYENGELSYQKQGVKRHKIRTEIPLNNSVVKVVNGKESVNLIKIDLYGYRNHKNENFRFHDDIRYKIIDTSHFYIYSKEVNVTRGKAKTRETVFYFSKDANAPIKELTINNLKHTFKGKLDFHYLIDLQFRSDKELLAYDSFYRQFKLKQLFNRSLFESS